MEGERILKSLLNGETDDLFEDTKNYLAPLRSPLKSKNGSKVGCKVAEETVSKYTIFATKFLRCAIEALKKVKTKGHSLDELTNSLNLVSTLLNDTLSIQNGTNLKFIPSLDQLGKTVYLIIVQLIAKTQFERAFCHANGLLKFIQLLKSWKNYDSNKMDKELASLAKRASDTLLQGAGKLEEVKVSPAQRASHLCVILDWRKLSLLFQAEAITHSSLESLVDRTLKCGTKYQIDCGQKNVNFKTLASFFESIFDVLMVKVEQLITNGRDPVLMLVELGFHYGRICCKAERSTQALNVFDKLLEIGRNISHSKNGQTKLHGPSQICCCVCLVCKVTILLNCATDTSQTVACEQMLLESNKIVSQLLKCKSLSTSMLKLLSDSMEYFRTTFQTVFSNQTDLSWRTFQEAVELLKLYAAVLSHQCEQIKMALHKANISDDLVAQYRQQLQKTSVRQLTVLNFVISSYQDQMKIEKGGKDCSKDSRCRIIRDCMATAQQASTLIHNALDDPDIPLSSNELRWLGSSAYNLGCVCYQSNCFAEGVPLLALACDELKMWSFAAETEQQIISRTEEVKLLQKYTLLTDCRRRVQQLSEALKTATTQVLITLKITGDADVIRQQIKQWTSVKHELVKNLPEEKMTERSRTLCSAFAEQEDAKDVVGNQLSLVLQEELACYKAKSYDTVVEQIAVIKQLMELYIVHEDEFQYGLAMLELAIAQHSLGDADFGEDKSALEYCQEAASILEQLSDTGAREDEEENYHSSVVQDRLAAAYFWQALLEHKCLMDEKPAAVSPELSESYEAEEMEAVSLEQPFISSIYSAFETWKMLCGKSVQQDFSGKIDLHHFANPKETCHYLIVTAAIFGLLNQPFKKVCSLYLAGRISQTIGTSDMLDSGLTAFSDAIHTLCDMLDISHACHLLRHATNLINSFKPGGTSMVQFLLAKSHYLLVTGKYSEGEDCLKEALQSEVFSHKSYMSHLLKARLKYICAKYSMLPAKLHEFTVVFDPMLGSLTALECAVDGLHKLSQMAEEIFGGDIFCSGKRKHKQKENERGGRLISSGPNQLFNLSLLHDLLSSLLQVGQLYAHQGAVREAFRQFVDGIALARQFSLSYRVAEFLTNIAQLEVMQGKVDKCQHRLDQLKDLLQPVLNSSSKGKLSKEGIQEPLFIEHPDACECAICLDPALHTITINHLTSLSNYFASVSRPEQSIQALEVAESVCESAENKTTRTLGRINVVLCGAKPSDVRSKATKKKRGASSAKGRKPKEETTVTNSSISQLMFSRHCITLYCMNAKLLLQNGKVEKASAVLSGAMELLCRAQDTNGNSLPVCLLPIKASLLHLFAVATLSSNEGTSSDASVDCNWFSKKQTRRISSGNTEEVTNSAQVDAVEEVELEMPRKGSSRRCRTSKNVGDKEEKKSSRAKGRGKSKKVEEILVEDDESDAVVPQKPKGRSKRPRSARASCNDVDNHIQAPKWLDQAIQYFNEAFELCQTNPPPALFSDICRGLAFCHGRSTPELSMYYLNMSTSVTLRHQAVTRTGKRIRRTAKDMSVSLPVVCIALSHFFYLTSIDNNALLSSPLLVEALSLIQEHNRDMAQLVENLSSLTLNSSTSDGLTAEVHCKLAELVKTRNIMEFISHPIGSGQSSSPFAAEEISLLQNIPKEWTVCTLETFTQPGSQDRELMICRVRAGCDPVLVKINTTLGEEQCKESASDDVVMDLTKLFQCSVMDEFNDIMSDSVKSMSINNTSEWWALRTRLNVRMKNLLEKLEASWLGRWKGVLLGQPINKDHCETTASIARQLQGKILHLCGSEPDVQLLEVLVSSSSHLSRKEATEALIEITGLDPSSPSLNELLDEFEKLTFNLLESGNKKNNGNSIESSSTETVSRHPVILILGKDIQHLPWESMPMLFNQPVTRVPSLQFLLSKVSCQRHSPQVDPVKTFYALNPQNNLPNTQKMFQKWFESEVGWQGITGKAPTQEEFSNALTDHQLFIYFGHGTGREFLQGDDVQRLDCRAVTLLMGCSSGKLMVGGECEPRGMALNYLLAGCPAIVANLWDVTDKDIDRFSESLLKQWLQPDARLSLPQVLSQSRQACKLKYLIGASPVLYGLPAYIKE